MSPLNKYCSCSKVFCGFLTSEVCTVTGDWRYSSPRTSNSSKWTTLSVHSHTGNHTITALANALICINKFWYSNIISQWVELTPDCSLHDFCSKPLQYQFHQGATQCNTDLLCLVNFLVLSGQLKFCDPFLLPRPRMTNSYFSKQQWPSTAICLGWRREEFAYSMHWCVPLRGTESSRCFVSAVGGRFSVLNVRCDMLWLSSLTVETDSWVLYIIQIISEMLVSSCISFNKADNTIRELDRFSLEMSWTMDRCLGNEPFWQDIQYICITTQYESVWTIMNMSGFVLKTYQIYQPIISYRSTNSVRMCSLFPYIPIAIHRPIAASRHESRCTCAEQMRWPPCEDTTWHRLNHLGLVMASQLLRLVSLWNSPTSEMPWKAEQRDSVKTWQSLEKPGKTRKL